MKKGNAFALLPIGVFLLIYLGLGLYFEYGLKIEMGFYNIPIVIAFLVAILVACLQNPKVSFEKKLEILKDPHTGAFAIIYGGIYLLAMLGLYNEVSAENLWVVAIGFVLSRSLSGISVVAFKGAKNTGTAADFRLSAEKRKVFTVLVV